MSFLGSHFETSSQELTMEAQQRIILRGKRTKRSRPSTMVTSSSSTATGGGETGHDSDAYFSISSPQSYENSASTQQDEDMANCLMLLAQSGSSFNPKQDHMNAEIYTKKFTSRKFNEMASSTSGKEEFYAYECKTCNRSFTSFQALGGHRASHKKPKNLIEEKRVLTSTILNDKEDEEHIHFNKTSPSITQQKAKVHECSICGSEFSSGQALGGHMRRHRIPTTNTTSTTSPIIDEKPRNHVLQLDLNLPAPEDDHYDSKFQFVFSTPALVDCQY